MGLFSTILEKLGLKKDKEETKPTAAAAPAKPAAKPVTAEAVKPKPVAATQREKDDEVFAKPAAPAQPAAPAPMSEVDVVKKLEQMAAGSSYDWKVSIVDLLKVLGMDADKDSRIELAKELGCPADLIGGDYSKMNVWLHKEVLKQIAKNGGNIPANLLG